MSHRSMRVVAALLSCAVAGAAAATDIRVLSASALEPGLAKIADQFKRETNNRVRIQFFAAVPQLERRLSVGEPADVLIAPAGLMNDQLRRGKVDAEAHAFIGRVGIGVTVRAGAPDPDIASLDRFKQSLLGADSIVYNHASTGLYLEKLFDLLGIAEQLKMKTVRYVNSTQVLERDRLRHDHGDQAVRAERLEAGRAAARAGAEFHRVFRRGDERRAGSRGREGFRALHRYAGRKSVFFGRGNRLGAMAASLLDKVDVHDAGDKLILSSQDEAMLRYVIEEMRKEGAQDIQVPVKVGGKWVASFEHPGLSQCTVEKIGFEIIITGPTEGSVLAKSGEFRERGALIARGPEKENGAWKLYLEDVGARTGNTITS